MNIVMILAGGKGTRMMQNLPKQFLDMYGKPLVAHTLEKFNSLNSVDSIVVVCLEQYVSLMNDICNKNNINKLQQVVIGGASRHDSIKNGLVYISNAFTGKEDIKVLIHNANMPLVTESNIIDCFNECKNEKTITTSVAKCTGYFYQTTSNGLELGPDRKTIMHAKVPECLYLKTAIELYNNEGFAEKEYESYTSGMLGIIAGLKVLPVECATTNMKVTTSEDFELVKTFYKLKEHIND